MEEEDEYEKINNQVKKLHLIRLEKNFNYSSIENC